MRRREFLQFLTSTSVVALTAGSRALAQKAAPAQPPASQTPTMPATEAPIAMPDQWRGKGLTDMSRSTPKQPATPTVATPPTKSPTRSPAATPSPIQSPGGDIRMGVVGPSGRAAPVPQSLRDKKLVLAANDGLRLDEINASFNPFRQHPLGGAFKDAGEMFVGRAFIPVRGIMAGTFAATAGGNAPAGGAPVVPAPLQPVVAALSEAVVLKTPANQFLLETGAGNRVVFYESEGPGKIGHSHIDRLAEEFNVANQMRLIKLKSYLHADAKAEGSQGGSPADIAGGGNGCGTHHAGSFSLGYRDSAGGRPKTLKSDWPSSYGKLDDGAEKYNAHLLAIDYQGGVRDPIPAETRTAYNRNADLWDCCAGAIVPFSSGDLDPSYRDYTYNPLDVYDQKSATAVAQSLARFDAKAFLVEHGSFYCAEGQYIVANLGPQETTLLKKSKFGNTEFGKRIDNFLKAPGYAGKSMQDIRRSPKIGWDHLKQLGFANGGITNEQYNNLLPTDRINTSLEWIAESVKGWQAYRPLQAEGLIARPMTVATLAWGLFRNYMPIGGIAQTLSADLLRAFNTGAPPVKAAMTQMCDGKAPNTPAGQQVLGGIALKAAVGFMLGMLSNPDVKGLLLKKAGYEEIKNPADKKKVEAAYDDFVNTFKAADFTSQASVDKALWDADAKLAKVVVEREKLNKTTGGKVVVREALMRYAAPTAFLLWAQHPFLAETNCLRYVATAMHVKQAKTRPAIA